VDDGAESRGTREARGDPLLLHHVRALADMTAELSANHDLTTSSRLLLLTLLGALGATRGGIWLREESGSALHPVATRGREGPGPVIPWRDGYALPSDSPFPLHDPTAPPEVAEPLRVGWPELAWASSLMVQGEFLGVVAIGPRLNRQPYSAAQLDLLRTLARMAATGIHSHRLISGLKEANRQLVAAQDQLIRSEQLATLGSTAAGIAHEIGNPLQCILGFAQAIDDEADRLSPAGLRELIRPVIEESERMRQILEELKDHARSRDYELTRLPLVSVVEDALRIVQFDPLLRARVRIDVEAESDPVVLVHPGKLKQVLLNLVRNAAQALQSTEEPRLQIRVSVRPPQALVTVQDNGPGIPTTHLERIWEPFFSTKGHLGTGLVVVFANS